MRKYVLTLFIIIYFNCNASSQATANTDITPANTISAQPINNYFTLKRGESQSVNILVNNKMPKKMQFRVYVGDWHRDSTGAHVYSAPGTEARSCSRWLTVSPLFLEVDSMSSAKVNVKLQIPDSAGADAEMKWSMVFIETTETSKAPVETKEMKTEIVPRTRFGIHINQTPPAASTQKIEMIGLVPMEGKKGTFRIIGQNTGQTELLCKSYIELSSEADGKKYSVSPIQVPVFPDQKRYFDFDLPSVPKGKYTMVGVIDPGNNMDIEAAQISLEIN